MSQKTDISHPSQAELLLRYLERERDNFSRALEGLSDYDVRRPMTPTGTSLLGLVKHVAGVTLGYFGDCVGRPSGIELPWDNEASYAENGDMWATADESREELLDLHARAWAHADESVRVLGLDAPATVPWWPEERRETTLGYIAVHMLAEIAHHAGHADILREEIDGRGGRDHGEVGDAEWWDAYVAKVQAAADAHQG
ncbi:MAG: DinB family protein [Marmoricola sp.]